MVVSRKWDGVTLSPADVDLTQNKTQAKFIFAVFSRKVKIFFQKPLTKRFGRDIIHAVTKRSSASTLPQCALG